MNIEYTKFKKEYMSNFGGYVPTYVTADEEYSREGFIQLSIEMIAPWRMTDGPSRFFRVITIEVDKYQYEEVKDYFKRAGKNWKKDLNKGIKNAIDYSNKFKEIDYEN